MVGWFLIHTSISLFLHTYRLTIDGLHPRPGRPPDFLFTAHPPSALNRPQAIPLLASVGGLLLFFIFIYAVAAVQLFPKTYHWVGRWRLVRQQQQQVGLRAHPPANGRFALSSQLPAHCIAMNLWRIPWAESRSLSSRIGTRLFCLCTPSARLPLPYLPGPAGPVIADVYRQQRHSVPQQ